MEIISREIIKPSSTTPHYLHNYQLSFLDQIAPPIYPPLILFYESNPNINFCNDEQSDRLKASLSETLSRFYPLAGRLVNNESIHCNDEGVLYIEAHVRSKLFEVIHNPVISEFDIFLPRAIDQFHENVVLSIQVNFFDCGGLVIGICMSHKLADASSRMMFLNSWAATSRGDNDITLHSPIFESANLFPPKDHALHSQNTHLVKENTEKIITKMFVFSSSALETLRTRFSDEKNQECPIRATRVEALSAFLVNMYAVAIKEAQSYWVIHALNLRGRMEPPLSKYHFGNFFGGAKSKLSVEEVMGECSGDFVRKMRGGIKGIDGNYVVHNIREGHGHESFSEIDSDIDKGEFIGLIFTSYCRMGAYEIDFGWGKPSRVSLTSFMVKNVVRFMDTRDGGGIEAWISMEDEDMAKLEAHQEFISYVSPTMA